MPDATPPDQTPQPRPQSAEAQQPAAPTDWRLVAIVGLVVLLLIAIYVNRRFYGDKPDSASPPGQTTGRTPQPPQTPPLKPAEEYARVAQMRQLIAAEEVFRCGDRVFIMARTAVPIRSPEDPNQLLDILPGALFDITKRLEGVSPLMFHRRILFGGEQPAPMFADGLPPLGLTDQIKMTIKPAAEVTPQEIADTDGVIGVVAGGEARAYPVKMANIHDVINDTLGGKPIAVTWSFLANAALAMERSLPDDKTVVFGSAGLLYQGVILCYDAGSASLWSPLTRAAVAGEMTGARLTPVRTWFTPWQAWKTRHPDTTALVGIEPPLGDYTHNPAQPMTGYMQNAVVLYPVYGFDLADSPMNLKTLVFGVRAADGKAVKAYAARNLRAQPGPFEDAIGGHKVTVRYDDASGILEVKDEAGADLFTDRMFWMCWFAAHPDTEVWQKDKMEFPFTADKLVKTEPPPIAPAPSPAEPPLDLPGGGTR